MNRKIKFRVWTGSEFFDYSFVGLMEDYGIDSLEELFNHKELICQQFTGLQDIKGKDIYEGDIIKYPQDSQRPGYYDTMVVEWDINHDGFGGLNCGFRMGGDYATHKNTEIIGNIFETPKLLEK